VRCSEALRDNHISGVGKLPFGRCHLCGTFGKLSFEHVPPESAFNDRRVLHTAFEKLIHSEDLDRLPYRIQQRGAGAFTLCEKCNNTTGKWYVPAYSDWAAQAMSILMATSGHPTLTYLYRLFPLRILKQIVCMFFSVNGPSFCDAQPDLVRFVLNKELRVFPKHIRVYCFYTFTDRTRASGVTGLIQGVGSSQSKTLVFSEITFPPFGFVMTTGGSPPPWRNFCDVSGFSEFGYQDWRDSVPMRLPVMPIYTGFPGDYRSRDQTLADVAENNRIEALLRNEGT
jgi:hypothetical protein